ncbi:MAG: hypothetical protein UT41_C0002G0170 [Candidatus Wolfebacteria bacterium GW2011_GWC2_39_22]|uniref:Uncharacterized protein n=2 Tax=Candidatus Wolfeibacteriota TaxID=1752735 RepID=A0A0G1K623_9BACT|nr:MAG: hypothetical protein UT41_C0002G0170 [Candidatus Wolfebacteria bacterium GW2011_GWC2_39_22]KKT43304.1 MAG: hypothetical protein UW32_C0002G0165 [Candidatus Wolfebacteria bacterium GW2011_GWE2_44_13]
MKKILLCLVALAFVLAVAGPALAVDGGGTKVLAGLKAGVAQTAETLSEGTPVVGRDTEALTSKDIAVSYHIIYARHADAAIDQLWGITTALPAHVLFGLAKTSLSSGTISALIADNRFSPATAQEVLSSTGIAAGASATNESIAAEPAPA